MGDVDYIVRMSQLRVVHWIGGEVISKVRESNRFDYIVALGQVDDESGEVQSFVGMVFGLQRKLVD